MKHLTAIFLLVVAGCSANQPAPERESTETISSRSAVEIDDETLEVAVAVFTYMFVHAEDWDNKINRRFVSLNGHSPPSLIKRLRTKSKFPVHSPYIRLEKGSVKESFVGGRYLSNTKDSLFYRISDIAKDVNGDIRVQCSVTWHSLAARGYEYTLEKKDGIWVVIKETRTWLS